jgi:hypothetical protein
VGCLRRSTRVHFVPGSMAPVTFDLGPARSRSAAYHFHPFAGGQPTMSILLGTLRSIALGALLHEVGKLDIPEAILRKKVGRMPVGTHI